eukprot:2591155-Pyramimonas_sp.AAC.1
MAAQKSRMDQATADVQRFREDVEHDSGIATASAPAPISRAGPGTASSKESDPCTIVVRCRDLMAKQN